MSAKKKTITQRITEAVTGVPQTGAEIVAHVEAKIRDSRRKNLEGMFHRILTMKAQRHQWIAARQAQLEELEKLQVKAVTLFDDGKLSDADIQALNNRLRDIENEAVSRKSSFAKPARNDDDDMDDED